MEKLKHIVEYAMRNVPYYSTKYEFVDFSSPKWFEMLPILEKKDIQKQPTIFYQKNLINIAYLKKIPVGLLEAALCLYIKIMLKE